MANDFRPKSSSEVDMDMLSGSGGELDMEFASGAELEDVPQAIRN